MVKEEKIVITHSLITFVYFVRNTKIDTSLYDSDLEDNKWNIGAAYIIMYLHEKISTRDY